MSQAAETLATHSMESNKLFFVRTERIYNEQQLMKSNDDGTVVSKKIPTSEEPQAKVPTSKNPHEQKFPQAKIHKQRST